jgi:hypothetical protein
MWIVMYINAILNILRYTCDVLYKIMFKFRFLNLPTVGSTNTRVVLSCVVEETLCMCSSERLCDKVPLL